MSQTQFQPSTLNIEWRLAPQEIFGETNTNNQKVKLVAPSAFVKKMRRYAAGNLMSLSCTGCSCV